MSQLPQDGRIVSQEQLAGFTASRKHEKGLPSHPILFHSGSVFDMSHPRSPNRAGRMRCFEQAACRKELFIKGAHCSQGLFSGGERDERALC